MLSLALSLAAMTAVPTDPRPTLILENAGGFVTIDPAGGSIIGFQQSPGAINPFTWDSNDSADDLSPRARGHFICLDRWGPPSPAEAARGMPKHGESIGTHWTVDQSTPDSATLTAHLPLARFDVARRFQLGGGGTVLWVEEAVTNTDALGRIYNFVQHPTIGPPFLDETTLVDCNGTRGFFQGNPLPHPESAAVTWPTGRFADGREIDLRRIDESEIPSVMSYLVTDEFGWITAVHPKSGLMLGFVWRAADQPWINLWQAVVDGLPWARGLEFGTSGLHHPPAELVKKGRIFDAPLYRFIDAGETQTYRYATFLVNVPRGFAGVERIHFRGAKLLISERGNPDRSLTVALDASRL